MRQSMPSSNIDSCAGVSDTRPVPVDRPEEVALLQPLAEQAHALSVEPKQLDQPAAFTAEGEQRAAERVFLPAPAGPASPDRPCLCACRCGRMPARPARPMAERSSAQHRQHAAQGTRIDPGVDANRRAVGQGDLDQTRRPRRNVWRRHRLRRHFDAGKAPERRTRLRRLQTPAAKYRVDLC